MKQRLLALTSTSSASLGSRKRYLKRFTYEPISSVWEGTDGDLLEAMFRFYASIDPEPILDSTYNAGRFWKGSQRHVISMDIDPRYKPMILSDNRRMKGVPAAHFGSVVYDPP